MQKAMVTLVGAGVLSVTLSAQGAFYAARYRSGGVPPLTALTVGGGQVFLELTISRDGIVTDVKTLRTTPPFTAAVADAARGWQFFPAEEEVADVQRGGGATRLEHVASKVLVAGLFRQPVIIGPTLGEPTRDVAAESDETPFPVAAVPPPYPQPAREAALVMVEAGIDRSGNVVDATVLRSAPPFDEVARAAARQWTFRPARVKGQSVPARAYLLFGFPAPVTIGTPPPPSPGSPTVPGSSTAPG